MMIESSDIFEEYLHSKSVSLSIAKTDKSYRKKTDEQVLLINSDLATLGDAVLRLALTQALYEEKAEEISNERQRYESDEVLVTVIGKHYHIRRFIRFDNKDPNKKNEYVWSPDLAKRQKYIATAVEACLGAFYLDHDCSMKDILRIVKRWKELVDGRTT